MLKPNILLIITDQQSADWMSCVGNNYVNTPAMDSIAEEGVVFRNSYCSNPVCVPSRVAMFTGHMPHEYGIYQNAHNSDVLDNEKWLGKTISEAGYDCGFFGKWHNVINPKKKEIHGWSTVKISKLINRDVQAQKTCRKFIKKKRNKPFFAVASFINPHDICQFARRDKLLNGSITEPPPADQCPPLPDNFCVSKNEPDVIRETHSNSWKRYPTKKWTNDEWRQYLWAYGRLVEKVDNEIGKILKILRETNQYNDTVIIFVGDHGEGLASHHWNQKQVLYENVSRVPFIISHKGKTLKKIINTDQLVSTGLDLYPTICDFANADIPKELRGISIKPVAEGLEKHINREYIVSETEFGTFVDTLGKHLGEGMGRMIRTNKYKYIVYSKGNIREQLFDMDVDPLEMNNLAYDETHKQILQEHRMLLKGWCEKTNDDFNYIT